MVLKGWMFPHNKFFNDLFNGQFQNPPPPPNSLLCFASLDGQMPHRWSFKEGQISHPPSMLKQLCKTFLHT